MGRPLKEFFVARINFLTYKKQCTISLSQGPGRDVPVFTALSHTSVLFDRVGYCNFVFASCLPVARVLNIWQDTCH